MAAFPTFHCPGLLTETAPPFLGPFRKTHSPTAPSRYWACLNDSATVSAWRRKWTLTNSGDIKLGPLRCERDCVKNAVRNQSRLGTSEQLHTDIVRNSDLPP